MGKPKPALGHATRTDAIRALRAAGLSTGEIADRLGITRGNVLSLEANRRESNKRKGGRNVRYEAELIAALAPHAAKRGMCPTVLATLLVKIAVVEDLVDSVLDDQGDEK